MVEPIDLGTYGALLKAGYGITGDCLKCNTRRKLDLSKIPPDWEYVGRKHTCKDCGGELHISITRDSWLP